MQRNHSATPQRTKKLLVNIQLFFSNGKLHAYSCLLLLATFIWMAIPYNNGLDMDIQKWVQLFKIAFTETKPPPDQIIFIDVARSRYLLPVNSDSTENDAIVNRRYLTQLFGVIAAHQNKVKYVLTDVVFDSPTADDAALKKAIGALGNRFLSINNYKDDGSLQKNVLGVRAATASTFLQNGSVYKLPLEGSFNDTLVSCKMYLDMTHEKMWSNFLFTWFVHKGIAFNSQINDHYLRERDFNGGNYVKIGLGELTGLLKSTPQVFTQYLQNRYILIGDFENDVHNTYLNAQPGTLVLFNAYWHLKNNRQILSVWYLIILYLFLYLVMWLQVSEKDYTYHLTLKIIFFEAFTIPVNIISISILLIVFTLISSLVFGVNISVFHLIAIFSVIDIIKFLVNKLENKA